jgi:hypothetical protein
VKVFSGEMIAARSATEWSEGARGSGEANAYLARAGWLAVNPTTSS